MSEKTEAKFTKLWAAFEQARAERRDSLAREMPETPEAFAALDFQAEGEGESRAESHLAALSAERKALKKLSKFVRKHGADVRPTPPAETDAPSATPVAARSPRKPRTAAVRAATKVRTRAKAGVSPAALSAVETLTAPPARRRRVRAEPKPPRRRGPGVTPKA